MKRILISDLKKKYGNQNIKNGRYQKAINDIMNYNRTKITNSIANMTDKKIKTMFTIADKKTMKFPIINDIAKKHDLLALKAADKGNWVTQTIRDKMTKDLREVLKDMPVGNKLPQSVVKAYKQKVKETFEAYTKDDPFLKVPSNIRNIAVTETKSAVNNIRKIYMDELSQRNPDLDYKKEWKHYKSYSKEYRRGHEEQNGVIIGKNDKFKVREFKKIKGTWKPTGKVIYMDRPHDDEVNDKGQVIGCSCELKYHIVKKNINNTIKKGQNEMLVIKPSKTADTRSSDYSKVTKKELLESSLQHIGDVKKGIEFIKQLLDKAAKNHDFDKIRNINEFYSDFITGFENHTWWDNHRKVNRHHLQKADGVPIDVNLIDVIEMIIDCVMAGMARTGTVYDIKIDPEILKKSFDNTINLLRENIIINEMP